MADPTLRLVIAAQAIEGNMTPKERTAAVRELIDDGMTVDDIAECVPGLLPVTALATTCETPSTDLAVDADR